MRIIGVTGGVGCGKSTVLSYVEKKYDACVLYSDEAARFLMQRGEPCFAPVVQLFGKEVIGPEGELDRAKIAALVFQDEGLRQQLNGIVHPAVRTYILKQIQEQRDLGRTFFFLEAALLVEEKYNEIYQELWYVYADEAVRRERLKKSRGYSDEKITAVMRSQLTEREFRAAADVVIDNSGAPEETQRQVDRRLAGLIGES